MWNDITILHNNRLPTSIFINSQQVIAQAVEEEAEKVFDKTFTVNINNVAESTQYSFYTTEAPTKQTVRAVE